MNRVLALIGAFGEGAIVLGIILVLWFLSGIYPIIGIIFKIGIIVLILKIIIFVLNKIYSSNRISE